MPTCSEYITTTILDNQVTVLIGETGSGKSTQLVRDWFREEYTVGPVPI